jgi:hypothetical protein
MSIKRIPLCLNTEDPEQKELYDFVTMLPGGKKRNSSAFLRMLVDREYQKKKKEYLEEKEKKAHIAPHSEVIKSSKGGIKYLPSKNIDQNTNGCSSCRTD